MEREHIVRSFGEELEQLNGAVLHAGGLAVEQLEAAIEALLTLDEELARRIVKADKQVNASTYEVDQLAIRILALRQPVAVDIRRIIASIKISTDIERIGDYAKGVAKHVRNLTETPPGDTIEPVIEMARLCLRMLREALAAYRELDSETAISARKVDKQVDGLYKELIVKLRTCMVETSANVSACTSLLFVARHLERIGDHIKNISNHVYYLVHGEPFKKKI